MTIYLIGSDKRGVGQVTYTRAYSQGQPSYPSRGVWTNRRDHHNQPRGAAAFRRGVRRGSVLHTRDAMMPSCGFDCVKLALKAAGFKVLVSVGELDAEIGRYCRSHGCFAVLSRDTDFVAMEAARYYLSVSHLDENMTTLLYDRDAITEAFGLSDKRQLPLLMALLANSCVPAPYLVPLHVKAMRRPLDSLDPAQKFWPSDLIAPLAQLVRNELWNLSAAEAVATILNRALAKYQPRQLNDFCKQLGFEDSTAFREALPGYPHHQSVSIPWALRLQLEASLVSHDYMPPVGERLPAPQAAPRPALTPSAERVLIVARQRQVALEFATPVVLALLEKRVWQESCTLEDPALPAGCCSAAALRHLRRRLYGVLLHDQAAPGSVREFIVACSAPASLKLQPADVTPIPLDVRSVPHPGLLSLWRGESGADAKWRLLAWCLCPSQSSDALLQRLRALPPRLVIPAAAMYLLRHTGALAASIRAAAPASSRRQASERTGKSSTDEPKAAAPPVAAPEYRPKSVEEVVCLLARTCVQAGRLSAADIEQLPPPRPRRQVVHLSALFMRTCETLVVLNDVLGALVPVDEVQPAGYFDGKLFHSLVAQDTTDVSTLQKERDRASVEALVRAACFGDAPCGPCSPVDAEVAEVAQALARQHLVDEMREGRTEAGSFSRRDTTTKRTSLSTLKQ